MATTPRPSPTPGRLWVVALVLGMSCFCIVVRLAYLQIHRHSDYARYADTEHTGVHELPAQRGALLDRNGYPLAISIPTWDVEVDRVVWADEDVGPSAAAKLGGMLKQSPAELLAKVRASESRTMKVARQVEYQTGAQLRKEGVSGVILTQSSRREYPEGDTGAGLIGFAAAEETGSAGLEHDLLGRLKGKPGQAFFEQDLFGQPIPFGQIVQTEPTAGPDVALTIDRTIQRMCETHLAAAIKDTGAAGGSVIVQDPKTGAVLCMVCAPTFSRKTLDMNKLGEESVQRLVANKCVTDAYEPGSVFKLVTVAAAINEKLVTPDGLWNDPGKWEIGKREFKNWDLSTNGTIPIKTILIRSLNTGTAWLAQWVLKHDLFYDYVRRFGFGQRTGVEVQGEASGSFRTFYDNAKTTDELEKWYPADLPSNSFGQGILTTPLQVTNMVSAMANGGMLMRPYVVQEERGPNGVKVTQPRGNRVLTPEAGQMMREMMRETLTSNVNVNMNGYSAGGKSGTAYIAKFSKVCEKCDAYVDERTIPSYAGFAPYNDPKVTVLFKLDDLKSEDFGGSLIGPKWAKLTNEILRYLGVAPDLPLPAVQQPRR